MPINQNKATGTVGANWLPQMMGYQDFKSCSFEQCRTIESQIWWLYNALKTVPDQTVTDDIETEVDNTNALVAEALKVIANAMEEIKDLRAQVFATSTSGMDWDCTSGTYRMSIAKERRMWEAEHQTCMTVDDMAMFTVDDCIGMECLMMATVGRMTYMNMTPQEAYKHWVQEQPGYKDEEFKPDSFIRKSDLTLIDVDNLHDHVIYGVLEGVKNSPQPVNPNFLREGHVHDLNELYVRVFDDVLVTGYEDDNGWDVPVSPPAYNPNDPAPDYPGGEGGIK